MYRKHRFDPDWQGWLNATKNCQLCDMFYVKMLLSLMGYKQKAVCVLALGFDS